MKLHEIATKFTDDLTLLYDRDEAKAIFHLVIEHYLKFSKFDYSLKKEHELIGNELNSIDLILTQLKTGVPIQYIIGETTFYRLPFKVDSSVLIPRPETEELVEWVLQKIGTFQSVNFLDIGTGSGCIAISIKKNLPAIHVAALDVSSKALSIAKKNAILNKVDIDFIHKDILEKPIAIHDRKYEVIASNPPYITQNEKEQMHENVLANEPHLALFVTNEKPLVFYEAIADFALVNLTENGLVFFEINEYLGKEMVQMLSDKGFEKIELRKDMQGKDRMICCSIIH
jgi:release factor glutamine methyltransferase